MGCAFPFSESWVILFNCFKFISSETILLFILLIQLESLLFLSSSDISLFSNWVISFNTILFLSFEILLWLELSSFLGISYFSHKSPKSNLLLIWKNSWFNICFSIVKFKFLISSWISSVGKEIIFCTSETIPFPVLINLLNKLSP